MKCLSKIIGIACFGLTACTSQYRSLRTVNGDAHCIEQFRPRLTDALYSTQVDILNHHLSGLLKFKQMPDSSLRVVFANEIGFKFFDFEFKPDGSFVKHYVLDKMDKKAVVKTLRGDFELVLLHPQLDEAHVARDAQYQYVVVPTAKGNNYYITDTTCTRLDHIEKSSRRKAVVKVWLGPGTNGIPDSIQIQHQAFKFNISLQHVQQ